jgi:hypothetical protein
LKKIISLTKQIAEGREFQTKKTVEEGPKLGAKKACLNNSQRPACLEWNKCGGQ